ncbi:MAG: FkbM family methyltransferase [Parvularculaceae bacterium]
MSDLGGTAVTSFGSTGLSNADASRGTAAERASLALKRLLLGSPLEPLAFGLSHQIAPLVRTALHPALSAIYYENNYQFKAVRRVVTPSMNCIDVGAHIGLFLRAFERFAPLGAHLAVEPLAWKAGPLRRKFPNATILQCALAERAGKSVFVEDLERSACSGLGAHWRARDEARDVREIAVDAQTLDAIALTGPPIGLIKLDVEGAETAVLKGGAGLIERDRPVILFECGASLAETDADENPFDVLTGRFGYRVFTVRNFVFGHADLTRDCFNFCRRYPATAFNFAAVPR